MNEALNRLEVSGDGAVDFISDLHLHSSQMPTFEAWAVYMQNSPASSLFILGDFFEVWAGDDLINSPLGAFEKKCAQVLLANSAHMNIYFMAGNRDFLLLSDMLENCGMQALADPCLLRAQNRSFVLSHGDAMCLSDTEYLKFRAMVRDPCWQNEFLARPLDDRLAIAKSMRAQSELEKAKNKKVFDASLAQGPSASQENSTNALMGLHDVDEDCARSVLDSLQCDTLIHGHTHRPGDYPLGHGQTRIVLSDWDASANPKRLEILRLENGELTRVKLQ
jgi:UDP-2,3-diacylglucosamine hydrolase